MLSNNDCCCCFIPFWTAIFSANAFFFRFVFTSIWTKFDFRLEWKCDFSTCSFCINRSMIFFGNLLKCCGGKTNKLHLVLAMVVMGSNVSFEFDIRCRPLIFLLKFKKEDSPIDEFWPIVETMRFSFLNLAMLTLEGAFENIKSMSLWCSLNPRRPPAQGPPPRKRSIFMPSVESLFFFLSFFLVSVLLSLFLSPFFLVLFFFLLFLFALTTLLFVLVWFLRTIKSSKPSRTTYNDLHGSPSLVNIAPSGTSKGWKNKDNRNNL